MMSATRIGQRLARQSRRSPITLQPRLTQTIRLNAVSSRAFSVTATTQAPRFVESQSSTKLHEHELFSRRHIGSESSEQTEMLKMLDPPVSSMEEFLEQTIPPQVRRKQKGLNLVEQWYEGGAETAVPVNGRTEHYIQKEMRKLAKNNKVYESFIGAGYYGTLVPAVIQRNVLENPAWYTSYTPYQAEISQGRLQSLLNFQTLITDLTGLDIANASVLDEATAAAEAMTMSMANAPKGKGQKTFVVSE
ncbi:hypothetical protein FG05_30712, partial [Fusarium graminearum]